MKVVEELPTMRIHFKSSGSVPLYNFLFQLLYHAICTGHKKSHSKPKRIIMEIERTVKDIQGSHAF